MSGNSQTVARPTRNRKVHYPHFIEANRINAAAVERVLAPEQGLLYVAIFCPDGDGEALAMRVAVQQISAETGRIALLLYLVDTLEVTKELPDKPFSKGWVAQEGEMPDSKAFNWRWAFMLEPMQASRALGYES